MDAARRATFGRFFPAAALTVGVTLADLASSYRSGGGRKRAGLDPASRAS